MSVREGSPEIYPFNHPLVNAGRRSTANSDANETCPGLTRSVLLNDAGRVHKCIFPPCQFSTNTNEMLERHVEHHLQGLVTVSRLEEPLADASDFNKNSTLIQSPLNTGLEMDPDIRVVDENNAQNGTSSTNHDITCYLEGCSFVAASEHGLMVHFETAHSDGKTALSSHSSNPLPVVQSKQLTNGFVPKKRARSASTDIEHVAKLVQKDNDQSEFQDPDYNPQPSSRNGSVVPTASRRYPGRTRNQRNPEKIVEDIDSRVQEEFTQKVHGIITGHDSDVSVNSFVDSNPGPADLFIQLRALASAIEQRLGSEWEVSYEKDTMLKDGYVALYYARLQSLLSDNEVGNHVLPQVFLLLKKMDDGGFEYQKPDPELVEKVKKGASNGRDVPELHLCSEVRFFGRDLGDSGWGCGYRNAQMLISSLLKWPAVSDQLKQELGSSEVPNITQLQILIHRAWERGFGFFAAGDLEEEVINTSKWIGTAEIQALFSSMKIECFIKDFSSGSGDILEALVYFVYGYFCKFTENNEPFVPPMFIQYSGHSRTIVGLDITGWMSPSDKATKKFSDKIGLLIFDPSDTQSSVQPNGKPTRDWYKKHIHCRMQSFKEETYQILFFTGRLLSDIDYERMKQPGEAHQSIACCSY